MLLARRIQTIVGSPTLAITAKAKQMQTQGIDVVNFGAGEPDFDTPDFIKQSALEALAQGFTKYTPSVGIPALREAISQKFKKDNQLIYTPEQIVVSCGAKHSLYNIIQAVVDEGDEVLIPVPYWVSYPEMVKLAGGVSKFVKTDERQKFKVTPHQLSQALTSRTKVLILNSPSNPTGVMYTRKELEALAQFCVTHQIYVISDEIYEKLIYSDEPHVSIASLGPEIYKLTATVNGVSKAYAMTGWRIGYLAATLEVVGAIKNFQDHTTSNPTSISQKAALAALSAPESSIQTMREEFKKRRDLMLRGLDQVPGLKYIYPDGAFYVFCDVSSLGLQSFDVATRILHEANVALIPGDGFGAEGYIRLSFTTSSAKIEQGIQRIKTWMQAQLK